MKLKLSNSPLWQWFFTALRRHPWHSAAMVVLSVLNSIADGLSVSLLIPFLIMLFGGGGEAPAPGSFESALLVVTELAGKGHEITVVSGLIVALVAFRSGVAYVEGLLSNWISGKISCDIRSRIHENLLRVNFEYVCVNDNGRLLNALDGEAWSATDAITTVFGLFTSLCMALVFSTILLLLSWKLTIVVVLLVVVASAVTLVFDRRLRGISVQSVTAAEDLSERAMELFSAMRMTRAYGREQFAQRAYDQASRRLFEISMRQCRVAGGADMLRDVLYAVNFVIVIFVALALGIGGATMIAYLALLHRLQPHVRAIDEARMELVSLGGSIDTVAALLALSPWSPGSGRELQPDTVEAGVRFERVSFAYSGKDLEKRNALDEVSLDFPVGKMTAVVGWSGAGKTTLINLLFRFYDPSSGSITLNGVPLQQLDLDWWRSQLSIAGQDAELIGGTIRENIAYGKEGATFAEIVDAAKRASVHDFVSSLPLGYETRVGSRGVLLSGGQRQRIGLARALLRRQGILVLDEATNSLDSMTEAEVLRSLEELRDRMTIIVIAHRLSTTRSADQVIALADGKVAEAGTPAELLRSSGLYSKMVQLQDLAELRGFALRPVDPEPLTN